VALRRCSLVFLALLVVGLGGLVPQPLVIAGGAPVTRVVVRRFAIVVSGRELGLPVVSGHIVAWLHGSNILEGKDLATGRRYVIEKTGPVAEEDVSISGTTVVWAGCSACRYPSGPDVLYPDNSNIVGSNVVTGRQFPVSREAGTQRSPRIGGHIVVWTDVRFGVVYARDLLTGREYKLSRYKSEQAATDGLTAVWVDERHGANGDVYGMDIATGRAFLIAKHRGINDYLTAPKVSGNTVVWTEWSDGRGPASIDGKNLVTGHLFDLRMIPYGRYNPQFGPATALSGRFIVWEEATRINTDSFDIYGEDVVTGLVFRVTNGQRGDVTPAIDGNTIVWRGVNGLNPSIEGAILALQ